MHTKFFFMAPLVMPVWRACLFNDHLAQPFMILKDDLSKGPLKNFSLPLRPLKQPCERESHI